MSEIKELQEKIRKLEQALIEALSDLKRRDNDYEPFKFRGEWCEDDCDGWDGYSDRCDCNGHKLCWVLNDAMDDVEYFLL